jgi:cytochrome c oxidase assembly protein subunit 15
MVSESQRAVALWLFVCCALVLVMVVLGGTTRLTRSGLSIVEWKPVVGIFPPVTTLQWEREFDQYKKTPEYRKVNYGMVLAEFKSIYWVEYAHRLLGRIIAIAFFVPFVVFLIRRRIESKMVFKLTGIFILGALQGALGWFMVASGLADEPRVSPYRLTAHLGLAVIIYGFMFWLALGLLQPRGELSGIHRLRRFGLMVTGLIFLMILAGGFVAGTKAGFAFNTFPLMDGRLVPEGLFAMQPIWINPFENIATVQFNHRVLAYLLCVVIPAYWFMARRFELAPATRAGFHALAVLFAVQLMLGIFTLTYAVPVPLAAIHQGGALAVFSAALYVNHRLCVMQA